MLADVIWCNDKSIGSVTGLGYGTGSEEYYKTGYSGYKRSSTGAPSLECPEASGSDKKLSKFTAKDTIYGNGTLKTEEEGKEKKYYKVGLFTGDELLFAGFRHNYYSAENNYIIYNAKQTNFTMTPSGFSPRDYVISATLSGRYLTSEDVRLKHYFRPLVSLITTVTATYNKNDTLNVPGSAGNPYIITVSGESNGEE